MDKSRLGYLKQNNAIVKKSFLVCGITNALDGSENSMIHCAKELPNIQLLYVDESIDDIFQSSASDSGEDSSVDSDIADSDWVWQMEFIIIIMSDNDHLLL